MNTVREGPFLVIGATHAMLSVGNASTTLTHDQLSSLGSGFKHYVEVYLADSQSNESLCHELRGDHDHIVSFLWYLNTRPAEFAAFTRLPPSDNKCRRVSGIAAVAQTYQCAEILEWAVSFVLTEMELFRAFKPSGETLLAMHQATVPMPCISADTAAGWRRRVQELWCDAIALTQDPASLLGPAQVAQDDFISAHAYFYILNKGVQYISSTTSLSSTDRHRLLCGALELARRGLSLAVYPQIITRFIPNMDGLPQPGARNMDESNAPPGQSKCEDQTEPHKSNGVKSSPGKSEGIFNSIFLRPFKAAIDIRIAEMRQDLVEIFFKEPWPLD